MKANPPDDTVAKLLGVSPGIGDRLGLAMPELGQQGVAMAFLEREKLTVGAEALGLAVTDEGKDGRVAHRGIPRA